jgi:hypothetical protein
MLRSIFCLVFILTNAVLAQAGENGAIHIATQKWVATYAATDAEIDGLPVAAKLEESLPGLDIEDARAAMVPSPLPVIRKSYRLTLLVSQNPRVELSYAVFPRTVSIDGNPRFAYVSSGDQDTQFVITTEADGSLHVAYSRKGTEGLSTGDFALAPIPHILGR